MIYRLCFVNFEPCDYFYLFRGKKKVLNLNLYSNTHTHTHTHTRTQKIKVAPFVPREIQLLKMIFKSLIELQPSRGLSGRVGDSKEQMIQNGLRG